MFEATLTSLMCRCLAPGLATLADGGGGYPRANPLMFTRMK